MNDDSFLSRFLKSRSTARKQSQERHRKCRRNALRVEILESRQLLAVVTAGAAANNGIPDDIYLVQNLGVPGNVDVYINGGFTGTLVAPTSIEVRGSNDDDVLTVDSANGLIDLPGGIRFFGGAGQDGLVLTQAGGGPVRDSERVEPGANVGQGTSIISDGGLDQIVYFEDLEPIQSNVPAASFTIAAFPAAASLLQGNNAIDYSAHPLDNTFGRVTIDSFEPIDFQNKDTLVIDAGAGIDTINIANPNTPTGLTGITVDGGAPGANDTLIVEAIPGSINDRFSIEPSAQGAGTIQQDNLTAAITYGNIESIHAVLQFSEDDIFALDATIGNDLLQFFTSIHAGEARFTGVFDRNNATGNGPFTLPNILVTGDNPNLGAAGIFNVAGVGGTDDLQIIGTEYNDRFEVDNFIGIPNVEVFHGGQSTNRIFFQNFSSVNLDLGSGDDQAEIATDIAPTLPITVAGGAGSDRVLISSNNNDSVTVRPNSVDVSLTDVFTPGGTSSRLSGVENVHVRTADVVTINPGAGNHAVRIDGSPDLNDESDRILSDSLPRIEVRNSNTLLISPQGIAEVTVVTGNLKGAQNYQTNLSGASTLIVEGFDGANDDYVVSLNAGNLRVRDNNGAIVDDLGGDVGRLQINTRGGDDLVTIDQANGLVASLIGYDGGVDSDTLQLINGGADATYNVGPAAGQGSILHTNGITQTVNFTNLEPVIDNVPGALVVNATNADNAINFAGNVISIDGFETLAIANKTTVTINALAGSDTISVNSPAGLAGPLTVNGGDPSAGSDTVTISGTAGADNVTIDQLTRDGARVTGLGPNIQVTTAEHLVYSGQGGGDALTITTPAGADIVTATPDVALGAGSVAITNDVTGDVRLPIAFTGVDNTAGTVTFADAGGARVDRLIVRGTEASDFFNVDQAGDLIYGYQIPNAAVVLYAFGISTPGVQELTLVGYSGDDSFNVAGDHPFVGGMLIDAGDPSASDTLNFTGNGDVTVDAASLTVTEAGFSPVSFSGVEHLNVASLVGNVNILGTVLDDAATYQPLSGSLGRITQLIPNTTIEVFTLGALTIDTIDGTDTVAVLGTSDIDSVIAAGNATNPTVTVNSLKTLTVVTATLESLEIATENGNDGLRVNSGTAPFLIPIVYDGGAGVDSLLLDGGTATVDTYTVGPMIGSGTSDIFFTSGGGGRQRVNFMNLEPVVDLVTSDLLVVNANNANNAINYSGSLVAIPDGSFVDSGIVSVDNHETIEFINKTVLLINSFAGDDAINLNNPGTPEGLTGILVDGGDPTASDTVTVTGTGAADNVTIDQLTVDGARISGLGPDILVSTTEHLIYSGLSGGDTLNYITDDASGIKIDFGGTPDSGNITSGPLLGGNAALSVAFTGLGSTGNVTVDSLSGLPTNALQVNPYDVANPSDYFRVTAAGQVQIFADPALLLPRNVAVNTPGVTNLMLNGLAGDDVFNIAGGLPFANLLTDGGSPSSGSDVVNLTNATAGIAVNLGTATTVTGYGGIVSLVSVETLNADATTQQLTVNGSAGNDVLDVTPSAAQSVTVRLTSSTPSFSAPVLNASNVGPVGPFTLNPGAGDDVVNYHATNAVDLMGVNYDTTTLVANVGFLQVSLPSANTERLVVNSGEGSDFIDVLGNASLLLTTIDGGPPTTPGDTLRRNEQVGDDTVTFGADGNSGILSNTIHGDVEFRNIDSLVMVGSFGASLTVNGTDGDDSITQRDSVTVNGFAPVTFASYETLNLEGGRGSDTFDLAPDNDIGALYVGTLNVNGGDPTASDTVIFNGTVAGNNVTIDQLTIDGARVTQGAGFTTVNITTTEHLVYNGLGGDDSLNLITPAGSQTVNTGAGWTADQGEILVNQIAASLLPVSYRLMGINGSIILSDVSGNRNDTMEFVGTDMDDVISVTPTGDLQIFDQAGGSSSFRSLAIQTPGISAVILAGLDGDDVFNVPGNHPFTPAFGLSAIAIEAGNPSASDTLNFNGSGGAITVDLGADTITEAGFGPVSFSGVEHINLDAAGGALTVVGTAGDDRFNFTPTGVGAGSFQAQSTGAVVSTSPAFTYVNVNNAALTVNGGAGGFDDLAILGTSGADTVTATATSVTSANGTVTAGLGLERLSVETFDGNDNITLTAFTSVPALILAGRGDDTVFGTTLADTIYGGEGNDVIIGGAGADVAYGEDGNDRFGDPAIADPAANDAGNDQFFGGAGSDTLVWDPGDGSDTFEGGTGTDVMIFNGSAGAETFTFNSVGARLEFLRSLGAIDMDLADVEQVNLNANGGSDEVIVNDLFGTGVQSVSLNLGTDGSLDTVTVNGRTTNDSLMLTRPAAGQVLLNGLTYTVAVATTEATDTLTLNGNNGNDQITAAPGAEAVMTITLNGGLGNDTLTGNVANIFGDEGDDTLIGGAGNQTFDGDDGDDTFVGNGGTDNVGGGLGASIGDTILLAGTTGADTFELALDAAGLLLATVNGVTTTYGNFIGGPIATAGIEQILVQGFAGDDTLTVDSTNGAIPIPVNYEGGNNADALTLTGGVATANTYLVGPGVGEGTSTIVIGGVTQVVRFSDLEPVIDLVAGPLLVIATNATNAIDVGTLGVNGLVSVDGFETIEFANKTLLTVDALAGDDVISITPQATPITINGDEPSASDRVIVDGTAGADTVTFTPTGAASGTVQVNALGVITLNTVEHLTYSGLGGDDDLAVEATAASDTIVINQGPATDQGNVSVNSLLGITYQGLGTGAGAALNLIDQGGNDRLIVNGSLGDDNFTVNAGGDGSISYQSDVASFIGGTNHTRIFTPVAGDLIEGLILNSLDGSDNFVINASALFTQGVAINAGNPAGGSDRVTVNGTAGNDTLVLTLDGSNDSLSGIVGGNIQLSGVENLTVSTGGGDDSMTVNNLGGASDLKNVLYASGNDANDTFLANGTVEPDAFTVTPVNATTATVSANGVGPVVEARMSAAATSTFTVAGLNNSDSVVVSGTTGPDTVGVVKGATTTVAVGGSKVISVPANSTESVTVDGGDGNDVFNVSGTTANGQQLQIVGGTPTSNAGAASDVLNITMSTAGTTAAAPGATPDAGVITNPDGTVAYSGIEFFNLVGAAGASTLNSQGTHDNDTIALQFLGGANRIWINDRAVYTFSNYQTVNLNGLFGDDKFSVHPVGLVGVTTINVAGGDPNASDQLVVNGTTGNDTINYLVSDTVGSGAVQVTGAPLVNFITTESLIIDGLGGIDPLTVTSPVGGHRVTVTPGSNQDSGTIVSQDFGAGTASVPLKYQHIGATAAITLAGTGDIVEFNGTANSDIFAITGTTIQITNATSGFVTNLFNLTNVFQMEARGHNGDDIFNVTGSLAAYAGGLTIDGGNPSASDLLNVTGAGGAITQDYGNATVSEVGSAPISYIGVELIDVDALNANVTVLGTVGDDLVSVKTTGPTSATVELTAAAPLNIDRPVFNASNIAVFTVNPLAGDDHLKVLYTAAGEQITVNGPAGTVTNVNDILVNFSVAGTEALAVHGAEGNDTFNVTPALNLPIFIDGGDPIGTVPGDLLNVIGAVGFFAGPENDEGGFITAGATVSFDHIESLVAMPIVGCPFLILGTNGDDDITVIARDASTHAGANGVRDFTVTVNNGPSLLLLDQGDLYIDAMAGDDDIVIRANAPNGVAWDVNVFISGGAPSDGASNEGDRVVLETPGFDNVRFTPMGSDSGEILIDENGNTVNDGNDSLITLGQFTFVCPELTYVSDRGGVELFEYDGEGAGDQLTIVGAAGRDDDFVHTPGTQFDEGQVALNTLLAVHYQNLGADGFVVLEGVGVDDFDSAVIDGTASDDDFTVNEQQQSVTLRSLTTTHVPVVGRGIRGFYLNGLGGLDNSSIFLDSVVGNRLGFIDVVGGDGSENSLSLFAESGVDEIIEISQDVVNGSGRIRVQNAPRNMTISYSSLTYLAFFADPNDADDLVVEDGFHDNTHWVVDGGFVPVDLIKINDREGIEFGGFRNVELVNNFGTDTFSIYPTHLIGYSGTLTVTGDAPPPGSVDDVLRLLGTEAGDIVTSNADTLTFNGKRVKVGENIREVQLDTFGANDEVALQLNIAGLAVSVDGGAGDDVVNLAGIAAALAGATIYGGDGNDTLTGGPTLDLIYGGRGNDVLVGGAGVDHLYGEEGNDTFGNPSVTPNGVADDAGNDFFFGGAGSDLFVWEPGDGSDTIEGGEGQDALSFFGGVGAEIFNVFAKLSDPARAILFRNTGNITMDMAGVDTINVAGNASDDRYVIGRANDGDAGAAIASTAGLDPTATLSDLSTTDVRVVNVNAATGNEQVFVDGRPLDDNLLVSVESAATGTIRVAGLPYDVRILGATPTDRLTVRGNEGGDTIKTMNPTGAGALNVENVIGISLAGGSGNDYLSADAILIGGIGNDFLEGGAGADLLFGNEGDDTMIGGGAQDTYDGGTGFDTILIRGTPGRDSLDVRQPNGTTLEYIVTDQTGTQVENASVAAGTQDTITNVEEARIEAGNGADTIRVAIADDLHVDANSSNSLRMSVIGGDDASFDRLAIIDVGTPDLSILRQNFDITAGTVEIGPAIPTAVVNGEAFLNLYSGIEFVQVLADTLVPTANPVNIESPAIANRLVVFKHDPYEHNHDRNNATHLGANTTINLDPNIDPGPGAFGLPGDSDWYRVEALVTGTIYIQVIFEQVNAVGARPGLPGNGDLNINVVDSDGQAIASFTTSDDNDDNERVRIPAVQGEIYYFQVVGDTGAINAYDVTVINLPVSVPFDLELQDNPANGTTNPPGQAVNSDSGRSQFDNHTYDTTPTILFRFDDGILLNDLPGNNTAGTPLGDAAIAIPFRAGPLQPNQPGFAIAIFDEGATAPAAGNAGGLNIRQPLGFATQVEPGLYSFTVPVANALSQGSHFLTARVQLLDPATPQRTGWGERSASLEIVVDTTPPLAYFGLSTDATDGLAPDPGVTPQPNTFVENMTNDRNPSFWGTAEANTVVRLYLDANANNAVDATDIFLGMSVTTPLDGTNQYNGTNGAPIGQWQLTSIVDLNDPAVLAALGVTAPDGQRNIILTAEDLSGNLSIAPQQSLVIFLDTQGPQVAGVHLAETNLVALTGGNSLLFFNSANPSVITATRAIAGLQAGDTVVGIDLRPLDNKIYAVVDGAANDRIYTIDPATGAATLVSTLSVNLSGTSFGVDFNPAADRLRIASDTEQNLRVNVVTGAAVADGALNPGNPNVVAVAYTNNVPNAGFTSLYTIDSTTGNLSLQNPPNGGTQVVIGALGVNFTAVSGFDIVQGTNRALAGLTVGGVTSLYNINLTTGAATLVPLPARIGTGTQPVRGLTALPGFDLFALKAQNALQGPTPPITSLSIGLQDLPARTALFLSTAANLAVVSSVEHYQVRGDHNGIIPIKSVSFVPVPAMPGQPAVGTVTLEFFQPLPDDRFTLTLSDSIVDDVGNKLDGESNANQPLAPTFLSGDGQPGGTFLARFTVDSRPEIATWSQGVVYVDINGNFVWDPEGQDNDATNRDFIYNFGSITDAYFVGNFSAANAASANGFDKIGSYGAWNGVYQFFLDTNDDGVQDFVSNMPAQFQVNGIPVAGNFSAAHPGDEIGLFDGQNWYLDVNGNNVIDANERFPTILRGIPVVGDFNGDGSDDLATFNNDTGVFQFDLNRDHVTIEDQVIFGFSGFGEKPLAADMNLDGVDDIGMWVPGREGQLPKESGEFHFIVSDTKVPGIPNPVGTRVRNVFATQPGFNLASPNPAPLAFSPAPLGNDLIAMFGDDFALPLIGNFDPPVAGDGGGTAAENALTNQTNPLDVNSDGLVTPLDALLVINKLNNGGVNTEGPSIRTLMALNGLKLDASGDGNVTPVDALLIINDLNRGKASGESEASVSSNPVGDTLWAASVDSLFDDEEEQDDLLDLLASDEYSSVRLA